MNNITFNKIKNVLSVCEYGIEFLTSVQYSLLNRFYKQMISEQLLSVLLHLSNNIIENQEELFNKLIKLKK